jgi:hypothetical protein
MEVPVSSSAPDFSQIACEALDSATTNLQGGPTATTIAMAQAEATIGLAYAVLAVFQYLPKLEAPKG